MIPLRRLIALITPEITDERAMDRMDIDPVSFRDFLVARAILLPQDVSLD